MSISRYVVSLADLAVIEITGPDAVTFLHGQLSHDIAGLSPGHAHLAGFCTAKGRLLGTMVVWPLSGSEVPTLRALIKADIADAVAKRLSMFVLRAKVKISVTNLSVLGVGASTGTADANTPAGSQAGLLEQAAALPEDPAPWAVVHTEAGDWIAAISAKGASARWWLVTATDMATEQPSQAARTAWQAQDIAAGLPWVQAAIQDVFIPQTLNLDLIDGVSFTKGCYPGQEVVARSHYRGTVKRRMAYGLIHNGTDLQAETLSGTDTFDANNPQNPVGRIVNAAKAAAGDQSDGQSASDAVHVLMEVQLADLGQADFRLGSAEGPAINVQMLPYDIVTP
ncbi:folate-binding protein [Pusillimonas sp. MFBS29]|uniref:CAF17-like 4Fe-4S cluster assembly/insertion protein YgfZ n=1 Tax=Pusillimonas sp. MFBS29 TaxID=2886690 RepID=UPI001D0FBBF4|nr:folate-binding protein [Pusillimonas sp. MFBS29]MCC2595547.1 folate-binding protein [Pusillimonas sp. MFBS29]